MLEMLSHAKKLSFLLKQPFENPAEAMVRMHEASIIIDRLVRKLEEPKPMHKKAKVIDVDIVSETEINPHENLDEAEIAEELDTFTRNNIGYD